MLRLYAALLQDVTEFMSKRSSGEPLATSKGEQGGMLMMVGIVTHNLSQP